MMLTGRGDMEAVIGLVLMILGVSHGVKTHCDGRQNNIQCYGALGGTVVLRLMDDASEIPQYKWTNISATILHGGKKRKLYNLLESRSSFTPSNGTFKINSLSRTDGGEYKLEIYDKEGERTKERTLQLIIEAPVSSVRLVPECLSNGQLRVSCSSEGGDSPQYSWTLDGRPLSDAQLLSGNSESSNITVRQDVSGQLACSVRNHVSHVSQEMMTRSVCGVETYCDGRQDNTQCYGALGGTVVLRLMDDASEIPQYKWTSKSKTILHGGKTRKLVNLLENRSLFTPSNGRFRINSLSRTDGGEHKLEIYDKGGERTKERTLQLIIEAPVSSVRLVPECLSNGQLRVSCSSEGGDSPQYSWTLDGRPLTDAQLLSGNSESSNITVRQDVSGQLACSVRNHVSWMSTCGFIFINCISVSTEDRSLLICGVKAAVVILILFGIAAFFIWRKKKSQTSEGSSVKATDEENAVVMVEM